MNPDYPAPLFQKSPIHKSPHHLVHQFINYLIPKSSNPPIPKSYLPNLHFKLPYFLLGVCRDISKSCQGHAGNRLGTCWGHAGDMPGTCRGNAGDMPGTGHIYPYYNSQVILRHVKFRLKKCPRYAKDMQNIFLIYAQDMLRIHYI